MLGSGGVSWSWLRRVSGFLRIRCIDENYRPVHISMPSATTGRILDVGLV
jgi:hypothetical protein